MTKDAVPEESKGAKFLRVARLADFFVMTNCLAAEIDAVEAREFDYPVWVRRCGRHVTRALFPRVYRSVEGKSPSRAYDLGLAAGMMESSQKMLYDVFEKIGPMPEVEVKDADAERVLKLFYGQEAKHFTFSTDDDLVPVEIRREILEMQEGYSLAQQADFHQGFADVTRMMAGENATTTTTEIYTFMLIFWRVVDRLPTFEVFHDSLVKIFGHNRVGSDPKRLRQICHRVGKRFRLPGRPPKTTSAERKR